MNFDSSPTLRAQRIPLFGFVFERIGLVRFPAQVRFGDIVAGLPVPDSSASGVYASHVLEHLSRSDFNLALANTFRILKPSGIFRLVVPDLELRARRYLDMLKAGSVANDWFMKASHLGVGESPKGLLARLRMVLGHSAHLWMWDEISIRDALIGAGFEQIRRCRFNDCADPMFGLVEDKARFYDDHVQIEECAMEARKPAQ